MKIFKTACLLAAATLLSVGASAQSRKYVSQFSQLQGYFNPGLIGYEGTMFRGFVRNQWAGLEGAPKTYYASLEFDLAEMQGNEDAALSGRNAFGLNVLHDQYGAFTETELIVGYASRIQLSNSTNLRLGLGVNVNNIKLDGTNLTTEQANDPLIGQYINNFVDMRVVDFNIGLAITHQKYYLSYGIHNVNKGQISSGTEFMDRKPRVGILQGGYRSRLNQNLAVISNFMYRRQEDLPTNIEFNLKALLKEKVYIGAGHRIDYGNSFQLGFLMNKVRLGYTYELPLAKTFLIPNPTHEFMLAYSLFGNSGGMIW
jgi:type IX secretion system PorP/SprF family membrane protein